MGETIQCGEFSIELLRKDVKHARLVVHPPDGRVTLVAPTATRTEVARAFAASKLGWLRGQRASMRSQAREPVRQFVGRESHYLWGRRYLLTVAERDEKPTVRLSHRKIALTVRPGADREKREEVMQAWHRSVLHEVLPPLVAKWSKKLGVQVRGYFLQRMKTKWGGCNPRARSIRINTELVKKPKDLREYVVVHELLHLLEPKHSERYFDLLSKHWPSWREARVELNELPLGAERWGR